jgi:hypothetical protein
LSHPEYPRKEGSVGNYLKIVEKAKPARADEPSTAHPAPATQKNAATKATEATKAPNPTAVIEEACCDKGDRSDERPPSFAPLTVSEVMAEIHRWGSGAGKNAKLYHRGELPEEKAVEYVTCAILARRGESFEVWRQHAPAVRKALSLCIHELEPDACKACNGCVRRLVES